MSSARSPAPSKFCAYFVGRLLGFDRTSSMRRLRFPNRARAELEVNNSPRFGFFSRQLFLDFSLKPFGGQLASLVQPDCTIEAPAGRGVLV